MKQSCNVIKDLLILYEDDACSEDSRKIVEEHLKNCQECRTYFQRLQCTDEVISEEIKEEFTKEDNAVKQGFKKIRRRWILSMLAVFMLIPAMGIGVLGYHEAHDEGIAFSNLDDIYRCVQYLRYIEDNEFEKAVEMVDFSQNKDILNKSMADMSPEQYQEYMQERIIKQLQAYADLGIYIDNVRYDSAYRGNGVGWTICVAFDENYPDGSEQKMIVHLRGETMYLGAVVYPYTEKVGMDDYIDDILFLHSEDDPMGYQEYDVTFELKEGEKAIISTKKDTGIKVDGLFNITFGTGTSLTREPYSQESFVTSVPGKYAITGYTSEGEKVYLTEQDIDITIVNY